MSKHPINRKDLDLATAFAIAVAAVVIGAVVLAGDSSFPRAGAFAPGATVRAESAAREFELVLEGYTQDAAEPAERAERF